MRPRAVTRPSAAAPARPRPAPPRRSETLPGFDVEPPQKHALGSDPLAQEEILEQFYRPVEPPPEPPARAATPKKPKPTHYKIVCISLYNQDIELLESLVAELKRRGHTKANKSQLIRAALDQLDLDKIPKSY